MSLNSVTSVSHADVPKEKNSLFSNVAAKLDLTLISITFVIIGE